jgi:recombination protein RecA
MANEKNERNEKTIAIEAALSQIEKAFGKGAIMRMGDRRIDEIPSISTSSIGIDVAIGIGGLPRGRITIFGPESSGKTTLASRLRRSVRAVAEATSMRTRVDASYAEKLASTSMICLSSTRFGRAGLEITEALVRSNAVDILVIDSVAALTPRAEPKAKWEIRFQGFRRPCLRR